MKTVFEPQDFIGGEYFVKNTSPLGSKDLNFKKTVVFQVVWTNLEKQSWGLCNSMTDGWARFYGDKTALCAKLNRDDFRKLTAEELNELTQPK